MTTLAQNRPYGRTGYSDMQPLISPRARLVLLFPLVVPPRLPWRNIGALILTSAALSCGMADEAALPELFAGDHDTNDLVSDFIETRMQPGSAAFVIPSPIVRDTTVEAMLRVSALNVTPDQLQHALEMELGASTTGASADVLLANRMVAFLTALEPAAAVIKIIGAQDRAVPFDDTVDWKWSVTPRQAGEIQFHAGLAAPVVINGSETSYHVRSFEKVVTVTVSPAKRVGDVIGWIVDNWVAVAGIVAALAGLGAWIMRRRGGGREVADASD